MVTDAFVTDAATVLYTAKLIEKYCVGMPETTKITFQDRTVSIDFDGFSEHEVRAQEAALKPAESGRVVKYFRHKERA